MRLIAARVEIGSKNVNTCLETPLKLVWLLQHNVFQRDGELIESHKDMNELKLLFIVKL